MMGKNKKTIPNPLAAALASLIFTFSSYLSGISIVEPNHIQKRIKEVTTHIQNIVREVSLEDDMILDKKLGIYTLF